MNLEPIDPSTTAAKGEYQIAGGASSRELCEVVSRMVSDGFTPIGGVALSKNESYAGGYKREGYWMVQAMWKSADLAGRDE